MNKKVVSIILIVLGIGLILYGLMPMIISSFTVTDFLDNTRKNAFVSSAQQNISVAKSLIYNDVKNIKVNIPGKYLDSCGANKKIIINLETLNNEKSISDITSPFGGSFKDESIVQVTVNDDQCSSITYEIYLTDGTYHIGTSSNLVKEENLNPNLVVK